MLRLTWSHLAHMSCATLTSWFAEAGGIPMRYVVELLQSRPIVRFPVLLVCALSLLAAAPRPAESQTTATAPPSLHILPIHRAKFLAGARFDLRVEANHLAVQPTVWDITIAGKTLEA